MNKKKSKYGVIKVEFRKVKIGDVFYKDDGTCWLKTDKVFALPYDSERAFDADRIVTQITQTIKKG